LDQDFGSAQHHGKDEWGAPKALRASGGTTVLRQKNSPLNKTMMTDISFNKFMLESNYAVYSS
jgi:hypothetical protein